MKGYQLKRIYIKKFFGAWESEFKRITKCLTLEKDKLTGNAFVKSQFDLAFPMLSKDLILESTKDSP